MSEASKRAVDRLGGISALVVAGAFAFHALVGQLLSGSSGKPGEFSGPEWIVYLGEHADEVLPKISPLVLLVSNVFMLLLVLIVCDRLRKRAPLAIQFVGWLAIIAVTSVVIEDVVDLWTAPRLASMITLDPKAPDAMAAFYAIAALKHATIIVGMLTTGLLILIVGVVVVTRGGAPQGWGWVGVGIGVVSFLSPLVPFIYPIHAVLSIAWLGWLTALLFGGRLGGPEPLTPEG